MRLRNPYEGMSNEKFADEVVEFLKETLPDPDARPTAMKLLYGMAEECSEPERLCLFASMNPILSAIGLPLLKWPPPC